MADLGRVGLEARSPVWWHSGDGLADGWHVAWLQAVPPGEGAAVVDIAVPPDGTAPGGQTNLTAGMTVCPDELVQVACGPPVALFAEGLDTALYRLDPAGPSFRRVTGWAGRAAALSASDDAAAIAVLARTAYAPRDVSAGPPDALIRISDTRPELRGITWGAQERLSWRAADGLELDGVLILPPGRDRADGPFPLVTLIHGGPYDRWADELMVSWGSWGQWLAAAGFAAFCPNPRGSQGHGQEFAAMVSGAVGQDEWTDILAGIDALSAREPLAGRASAPDRRPGAHPRLVHPLAAGQLRSRVRPGAAMLTGPEYAASAAVRAASRLAPGHRWVRARCATPACAACLAASGALDRNPCESGGTEPG